MADVTTIVVQTGRFALTVTLYCLPSTRPVVVLGSTNLEPPTGMSRVTVMVGALPSKLTKRAVAVASLVPRFWMMNGVT